jgi:hypothetical protein
MAKSPDIIPIPVKVTPIKNPKGFQKGNKHGKGNPHCKKVADYREAFLSVVTPEAMRDIVQVLIDKAKEGEDWAVKYAIDRALGKATQNINVEANGIMKTYLGLSLDEI